MISKIEIVKYAVKSTNLLTDMESTMAWSNVAEKLVNVASSPFKLMSKWAEEPLKNRAHKRNIDLMTAEERFKNEQSRLNQSHESKLKKEEESHITEQIIKRETETVRIIAEIEELKKDKQLERMKLATEALVKMQRELTKINTEAISSIGNMSLDLRNKATNLIIEKQKQCKEIQESAISKSMDRFEEIDRRFGENNRAKDIFYKNEDAVLAKTIDSTGKLIDELSSDLRSINKNIDLLQLSGQKFIENHLSKFSSIGFTQDDIQQLSNSSDTNETITIEGSTA